MAKPRPTDTGVLSFRYLGVQDVEELEDLWGALHQQHTLSASHLSDMIGTTSLDESWRRRRAQYLRWLADPETMAILAEHRGDLAGYAMVTIRDNPQGTWDRGARVAVVQTFAIDPEYIGTHVGSKLLEEIRHQLAATGIRDIEFSALATASEDISFLEREGFRPFVTTMVCRVDGFGAHD
ncbi:GNAT family N-acetyltransferase [Nocardiopsis algeriensis]|uniref:GNAT superfamily N-acetyltransferase n=1 Tax=Nocardiopsis algeriensis TaxID=1478215 RepID=A0A841IMS7_9ACTN|nr:GNAT family N-acetyltransferase [Nocardiopsis algeriensis]MBB6120119.1 GNAT superfamily N-acetyltransferase [Nocardiopsis algeriensis]